MDHDFMLISTSSSRFAWSSIYSNYQLNPLQALRSRVPSVAPAAEQASSACRGSLGEGNCSKHSPSMDGYIVLLVVTSSSQLSQSKLGQGVSISMINPTFLVSIGPINPEQTVLALLKSLLYLLVSDTSTHWRPDVLSSTVNSQLPPCSLLVLQ